MIHPIVAKSDSTVDHRSDDDPLQPKLKQAPKQKKSIEAFGFTHHHRSSFLAASTSPLPSGKHSQFAIENCHRNSGFTH